MKLRQLVLWVLILWIAGPLRVPTLIITLPANRDIYASIYNICIIYRYDNFRSWPNCKAINPYRAGTEFFWFNIANNIVADALATQGARTSSPMMHNVNYVEEVTYCLISEKISTTCMMTSSNGSIFRVTGHLCGEFTGPLWIPRTKASDAELWC